MNLGSGLGNYIRLLSRDDAVAYNTLIQDSFKKVSEFRAEPQTLCWTLTDDHYYVLGLFKNHQLVAFLRMEWIESIPELRFKTDEDTILFQPEFPIGYLAKAGTATAEKNKGLNSILRYHALKIFLDLEIQSVIGIIAEGSARHKTMEEIGYQFTAKQKPWNGNFKSDRKIVIGHLSDRSTIVQACERLEKKVGLHEICTFTLHSDVKQIVLQGRTDLVFPWSKMTA